MCEEVHFSKYTGLQAYSWQLYYQMNSFTVIFRQHFKSPHAPPMYWLKPPHQNFEEPPPCFQHLWETLHIFIFLQALVLSSLLLDIQPHKIALSEIRMTYCIASCNSKGNC